MGEKPLLQGVLIQIKDAHFWPSIWPLTLKDDLDLDMSPIKVSVLMRWIQMPNIKLLYAIGGKLWPMLKLHVFYLQFDLWHLRMTLTFHPLKCVGWCDTYVCQISSCDLQFDLWPWTMNWPWHFVYQNVRLDVTHIYAKYQVAICNNWFLNENVKVVLKLQFDLWPWRMTLTFHPSKCAAWCDTYVYQVSSCYLQ